MYWLQILHQNACHLFLFTYKNSYRTFKVMCASHLWLLLYSIRRSVSLDCGLSRPGAKVGEHVEAEFSVVKGVGEILGWQ